MTDLNALESLYFAALEKPPAERPAFLDAACGCDLDLRARVERLLAAQPRVGGFLDAPAVTGDLPRDGRTATFGSDAGATSDLPGRDEHVGIVLVGKYKLIEEIGEGGMGSVFMAQQTEPVKRAVAVKVIKAGMDSKAVLARFEAERQALAMMDHPNIARVLDAGTTESGRPFFVMELVKGVPITQYCDERKLTTRQRLELFVPVCQAIQHAHQKGIIHRDIKPSNVLVALYDDRPVPKVIDFGVAKAAGQTLTDKTLMTGFGAVVGTPEYMSPEQANLNNLDIDTRSDVYSLGVLLYELLTGSTPVDRKSLGKAALLEVLRIVREVEAPKPSAKLSSIDTLPSVAANRATEPAKLSKLMKGELDWVVLKALEKDRTRRYDTVNALSRDIQRYLADEVVEARPPSTGYRLKKFVRRYKGQVIVVSLVLFALVAGMAGTTWGLFRAEDRPQEAVRAQAAEFEQRQVAESNEQKAVAAAEEERKAKQQAQDEKAKALKAADAEKAAKVDADARRQEAERNLAFARKGNEILGSVFTGLDPKKNYATLGEFSKALTDNLKQAVKELDGSAIGDPLEVAAMQNTLGLSLMGLGEYVLAVEVLQKARDTQKARLGPDHPDTLTCMNNLATGYQAGGKLDKALPLYEETLALRKAKLGPDHPDTLATMNNLARGYQAAGKLDKALPLFEETLPLMKVKLGHDHHDTLASMNNLAEGYRAVGKLDKALPLLEETLALVKAKLGPDHPHTLQSMNNLAACYWRLKRLDKSVPLFEELLPLQERKLGRDHPDTLGTMANLGVNYKDAGRLKEAIPLLGDALTRLKARLGHDHPITLICMSSLATGYQAAGKLDKALTLLEETLPLMKAKLGPDHPDTLTCMNNLTAGYQAAGKLDKALLLLEETLPLTKSKFGPDHPDTLMSMANLADGYQTVGKLDKALLLLEETLPLMKAKLGPDHPDTLTCMNNLAACYWRLKRLDRSVPLFEELLPLKEKKLGRNHPDTLATVANLGVNYKDAGRLKEAIPLLEEAYRASKKHLALRAFGPQVLDAYLKAGKTAEAAKLIDELLADVHKQLPKDSPQLAGLLAQFGLSLLEVKRFAEAEPLLRECLAIREKAQPDAWTTFNTQSMLGGALLGQKKYADAEPQLLAGYEGMKQREETIPPQGRVRLPDALDRLIELYTAMNKSDEIKKWKAERARYPFVAPMPRDKK